MTKIAVVGSGLVGGSWSVVFARAGLEVTLFDTSPDSVETALEFARATIPALATLGLLKGQEPADVLARLHTASTLVEAVRDADHVQESAPERLPVKQALYRELDDLIRPDAVVASSTSGLPASSFTELLKRRGRCLVAHPINPPHLIPLVEVVPAPWTEPDVVERTSSLMKAVGQVPIRLSREIPGFVVNRLQGAMLGEAFRLVDQGIVTASEVDAAVTEGLGLRWFFIGPFETIDLNAQGGIADYCDKLGPMYYGLACDVPSPSPWSSELVSKVEGQRRAHTSAEDLPERRRWRDQRLAQLVRMKGAVLGT